LNTDVIFTVLWFFTVSFTVKKLPAKTVKVIFYSISVFSRFGVPAPLRPKSNLWLRNVRNNKFTIKFKCNMLCGWRDMARLPKMERDFNELLLTYTQFPIDFSITKIGERIFIFAATRQLKYQS
jgi:hypothetical protein